MNSPIIPPRSSTPDITKMDVKSSKVSSKQSNVNRMPTQNSLHSSRESPMASPPAPEPAPLVPNKESKKVFKEETLDSFSRSIDNFLFSVRNGSEKAVLQPLGLINMTCIGVLQEAERQIHNESIVDPSISQFKSKVSNALADLVDCTQAYIKGEKRVSNVEESSFLLRNSVGNLVYSLESKYNTFERTSIEEQNSNIAINLKSSAIDIESLDLSSYLEPFDSAIDELLYRSLESDSKSTLIAMKKIVLIAKTATEIMQRNLLGNCFELETFSANLALLTGSVKAHISNTGNRGASLHTFCNSLSDSFTALIEVLNHKNQGEYKSTPAPYEALLNSSILKEFTLAIEKLQQSLDQPTTSTCLVSLKGVIIACKKITEVSESVKPQEYIDLPEAQNHFSEYMYKLVTIVKSYSVPNSKTHRSDVKLVVEQLSGTVNKLELILNSQPGEDEGENVTSSYLDDETFVDNVSLLKQIDLSNLVQAIQLLIQVVGKPIVDSQLRESSNEVYGIIDSIVKTSREAVSSDSISDYLKKDVNEIVVELEAIRITLEKEIKSARSLEPEVLKGNVAKACFACATLVKNLISMDA